ncbi:type I restriction endonuclease [Limosilactobacillus fermentum]|uniref:type I restriction endonuclease n=1 Tax=Limosilactobacillus fermentum TaxID=1613 RepID=UPI001C000AA3|nr:type I restriction endonuclease [Limosilactobacillus fermentum]
MTSKFNEDSLEKSIISLFEDKGYEYITGRDITKNYEEVLLVDDLKEFIRNKYNNQNITDVYFDKIFNKLRRINGISLYERNKNTYSLVSNGFDLIRENTKEVAIHIDFIDFEHPENNIFKVVNQYTVQGSLKRRPDILLFINGIPVVIFEFKTAIEEDKTIYDAWKQVTIRYNRDIPNLTQYCFLSVISDGVNSKLGSIFTPYDFYYSWNKVNSTDKDSVGIDSLLTMMDGVFSKDRLISILRDFIYYPDNSVMSV